MLLGKTIILKEDEQTNFEKSLAKVQTDFSMPLLPLIHKADCKEREGQTNITALDYFETGVIDPVPCDVFGEDLVYTFVGRPSFRELNIPACFIIKPVEELIQNIFVFDSGAYYANYYSKVVDNKLDINLFRIPANEEMIKKFITLYYGDNTYYYFGIGKNTESQEIKNSVEEFDYLMLVRVVEFLKAEFDTRCRTLENILRTPISLEKYLMAVIVPNSMLKNKSFCSFQKTFGKNIDIIFYDDDFGQMGATKCNRQIDRALIKYYLEKGYISL